MYQIIKNVISRGGYDLKGVLEKIDTLWAQQRFTDEQHTELVALARHGAKRRRKKARLLYQTPFSPPCAT